MDFEGETMETHVARVLRADEPPADTSHAGGETYALIRGPFGRPRG